MAWQIIGHDGAVELLRRGLAADRVAHAYLFSGPPQVGKTKLALTLAQALNCTQPESPCGQCDSCRKIASHTHPDVRRIVGEGAGETIKIDQVRALQREAVLAPYEGRYRVYILRRTDLATTEAANSLLKTLEEPPEHVVLGLTAVHVEALPATVVSRCQRLDLRPVPAHLIEAALRDRGLPAPRAQLVARLSTGRVGWALQVGQDHEILHQRQQDLEKMIELLSADRVERLDFAWKASRDPGASRQLIELWTGWWRDLLLLCGQARDYVVNVDRSDELVSRASQSSLPQAWAAVRALQATAAQLDAHVNARLALEGLLLQLPHWRAQASRRVDGEKL
jgi:DNA polymerase-3 subunit delta'